MALFPKLKTEAVAQFPSEKSFSYSTDVLQFVDGGEQRIRRACGVVQRWTIALELLDAREWDAVRTFHEVQQGRFGVFDFLDPWDGVVYNNCSFENDVLPLRLDAEGRGRTKLAIRRNIA